MTNPKIFVILLMLGMIPTAITSQNTIPFQLAGKLIIVRATIDGQPGNFILDTGIPNLVLNERYFEGRPTDKVFHGVSGKAGTLAISTPAVQIGGHNWKKVYAEVIPMPALENSKGIPIHGLLGTELFWDYILLIDFQQLEMQLYPLNKSGANVEFNQLPTPLEMLPFKYKGSTPLITAQIGNTHLKLVIDTGAEINLLADKYQEEFTPYLQGQYQENYGGFGRQTDPVTIAQVSAFRTSQMTGEAMKTAFIDLSHFNRYVPGPLADGILGYEFLSQYRVGFNFKKKELYLWEGDGGLMVGN